MTKSPWFGPRTSGGWGWTPITWQGWTVTVGFSVTVVAVALIPGLRYRFAIIAALAVGLIVTCAVTGTKPGGSF